MMIRSLSAAAFAALLLTVHAGAQSTPATPAPPPSKPPIIDIAGRIRLDSTLRSFVESGAVTGVSALVWEKGVEAYFNAFGMADREAHRPMRRDALARIFSMTKPVIGVALMTLYEQGKFQLDDPVSKYIPELADVRVYAGTDASGSRKLDAPRRPMTIRDVTRHTAGFATSADTGVAPLLFTAQVLNFNNTLAQAITKLGTVPLAFHPGDKWVYGPSVDVQALLVERLSGMPLTKYLDEKLFTPLRMRETWYTVPEAERVRMMAGYRRSAGELAREPDSVAFAFNFKAWPLTPGTFGLVSSIDDYMLFARMLLGEGQLGQARVLKPETVRLMATNQLSDAVTSRDFLPSKGQVGFGIDFAVRVRPPASKQENYGAVGEFFWDGAASTLFWVDPANQLAAVLFVQVTPFSGALHKAFRDAVYGANR